MSPFIEYLQQFGRFSRNARLYLMNNVLSGVTTGILLLLYNLYLSSLGYGADFIGLALFAATIGAGIAIFPAGICVDRYSGKVILIWSNLLIGAAGIGQILFRQPLLLLISGFIAGIAYAFVLVINAPFLVRNSDAEERSHLFSVNIVLTLITSVVGSVLGGALPLWFRATPWLMSPLPHGLVWLLATQSVPRSYQLSLLFAGVIAAPSFIPLFMLREPARPRNTGVPGMEQVQGAGVQGLGQAQEPGHPQEPGQAQDAEVQVIGQAQEPGHPHEPGQAQEPGHPQGDAGVQVIGQAQEPGHPQGDAPTMDDAVGNRIIMFRKMRVRAILHSPIYIFSLVEVFIGAGAGLFINYFNLYFVNYLKASSALFGILNGGTIAIAALLTLAAPWLAQRIGRVKAIALTQLASIPLLVMLGFTTWLPLAALCFLLRQGFMDMSNGVLQVFSMEEVPEPHRGIANSSYQAAFQVPWALTAPLGGLLIAKMGYTPIFLGAAVCYLLAIGTLWGNYGQR